MQSTPYRQEANGSKSPVIGLEPDLVLAQLVCLSRGCVTNANLQADKKVTRLQVVN